MSIQLAIIVNENTYQWNLFNDISSNDVSENIVPVSWRISNCNIYLIEAYCNINVCVVMMIMTEMKKWEKKRRGERKWQ